MMKPENIMFLSELKVILIPILILAALMSCTQGSTKINKNDTIVPLAQFPNTDNDLDWCDESDFDDVVQFEDDYYLFKKSVVWKIKEPDWHNNEDPEPSIEHVPWFQEKPRSYHISDIFPKIFDNSSANPDGIDAAFADKIQNVVYILKETLCWMYKKIDSKFELFDGYPKLISEEFPGLPIGISGIQTAVKWERKGYIYFFKDNLYYRYERYRYPHIRSTYPKLIGDNWVGLPDNLSAAVTILDLRTIDPEVILFFKGLFYWKYNIEEFKMDPGNPGVTSNYFFGCTPNV